MWFGKKRAPSYERAMGWFRDNFIPGQGIILHTKKPVPYPEVTGYYIPTLYHWKETEYARTATRWLVSIQMPDGAFPASDGKPYTFDTGQILRGLNAASGDVPGADQAAVRAAEWMLTQIDPDGRVTTPSTELWGDIANELIHSYVLPPLKQAGAQFNRPDFIEAAGRAMAYYKAQADQLVPFNRLSHFHAYAMEALWEMGEVDLCRQGMASAAEKQKRDGSVPGYPDVDWVCSTGLAQYAIVWQHLGEYDRADRAIQYLEKIQNKSGGFNGSYGKGASYIPGAEISWAVKYFLDAWALKLARDKPA